VLVGQHQAPEVLEDEPRVAQAYQVDGVFQVKHSSRSIRASHQLLGQRGFAYLARA
jgi:hypothetical protein